MHEITSSKSSYAMMSQVVRIHATLLPVTRGATDRPLGAWIRAWSPTCIKTSWWPSATRAISQKLECAGKSSRVWSWRHWAKGAGAGGYNVDILLVRVNGMLRIHLISAPANDACGPDGYIALASAWQEPWTYPMCRFLANVSYGLCR